MPRFFRDNAAFVAPPFYIGAAVSPYGHSPIDIILTALAVNWLDTEVRAPGAPRVSNSAQLWVDGSLQGPIVYAPSGGHSPMTPVDPVIVVPAVIGTNVDSASRFGIVVQVPGDEVSVTIVYEPANAADAGKQVMALGAHRLCGGVGGYSDGLFSPPAFWQGAVPGGWPLSFVPPFSDSDIFDSPWELVDSGPHAIDGSTVDGVAATPIAKPATWGDFTIALRAASDGIYFFNLRADGVTIKTLEVQPGERVITYPGSVDLTTGQRISWQYTGAAGGGLDGEILWTSRAVSEDASQLSGAGVSAGESGGGL